MTWAVWVNLCFASFAISLSPGPGAVSSMASGLRFGFGRGYWNAVGLAIGYAAQYVISVIGVGAILATSPIAFEIVKWTGVAYLLYLGYKQYRSPVAIIKIDETQPLLLSPLQLITQGILVNLTNPKGAVFLIAVTPQFLNLHAPHIPQYIIICATLVAADMIIMAGYTGLASRIMKFMRQPHRAAALNKIFGVLFITAAVFMGLMSPDTTPH
ncbi:LysE family transporter [Pelistega europaea]|uniref:LysE family transporter n=1 Tax=Pelistega europaea TaxID=106147 RepID=A0A7Y4P3N1_9BURK|nr:LysE family transporter [Pelistega europaea]NOL48631.1 LysE family transporter [Pelistega europaea]